jgi:hypothetical protein
MATVVDLPGTLNFSIYVGATFHLVLTWTASGVPVGLSGYTAALTIRDGQDVVITLTTANGRIVLGGAAGTVTLTVAAEDTASLAPGTADYDLLLTSPGGVVTPLVAGLCTLRRGQTV